VIVIAFLRARVPLPRESSAPASSRISGTLPDDPARPPDALGTCKSLEKSKWIVQSGYLSVVRAKQL